VVSEVLRRPLHAQHLRVLRIVGRGVSRFEAVLVDRLPQECEALAVDRPETSAHVRVIDEHEAPVLCVPAARCADRGIEDARLHVFGNRVGPASPHGAGRVQRFVDVHHAPA
jgi:hypothetical protein